MVAFRTERQTHSFFGRVRDPRTGFFYAKTEPSAFVLLVYFNEPQEYSHPYRRRIAAGLLLEKFPDGNDTRYDSETADQYRYGCLCQMGEYFARHYHFL